MDTVSDTLIRIKNGYMAGRPSVEVKYSKLILEICKLLKQEGYIASFENKERLIEVKLQYNNRTPAVSNVKRVSKPGLKVYKGSKALPRVLNGLGIAIISTSKGLMTDKQARKVGVGGEILAEVW